MKSLSILCARIYSLSWHFFQWMELLVVMVLIGTVGYLLERVTVTLGQQLPQFSVYWSETLNFGQMLISFSEKGIVGMLVVYLVISLAAKLNRVKIIRSGRLSHYLHETLLTTVDQIPLTDRDRRDKAKNLTAKKANRSVRKSFVLARKNEMIAFVKMPRQIETQKMISGYLDSVAEDLSHVVNMTSSTWEDTTNLITFSTYKVMHFKR